MRRRHRETFTTIRTEGNLLPVDFLLRLAEGNRHLKGLAPDSFHLGENEKLNEVINRAWSRCEGAWRSFQSETQTLAEKDAGTTLTRERWLLVLFQELAYGRLLTSKAFEIDGKRYPVSHGWHCTPIHLVSFRQDLDRRTPGVAGAAHLSPHSLVQEFLNRSEDHLWGIVSNGISLRLLRDNKSLTRDAYVEFDLEGMMTGEVYSDFVLLFLLLHESRLEAERPDQCWLERWTQEAQAQGARALDQLRGGVENAIAALGQGLVTHPANSDLRQKVQKGELTTLEFYQQLLRLVYRMIFLFVAEDRNLLVREDAAPKVRQLYMNHYSITRIRRLAGTLRGTQHGDLWQSLKLTFQCLAKGTPALGLNPLGGFLFSEASLADFAACEITNQALLESVRRLSFTEDNRTLRPVDYRNLGTEELGSVYESLLELHPEINVSAHTFELRVAAGSARKTTGSYYTPGSLIRCLLDSALEPVIKQALKKPDSEKALLDLKVVDPACGSGHFLIAAAHRIGKHLAIVRTGEAEPPPEARRKALRDVVSHCIYGVDVNPLAVELCKVALWIETIDPDRPLGFLDHYIKCGNSLIGATPKSLEKGIPDDAFKPVEGDDKKVASFIRNKNKQERKGQRDIFAPVEEKLGWQTAAEDFKAWGQLPEEAFGEVCEKVARYGALVEKPAYQHEKQVADLWTAAFFWPLSKETVATVPTEDVFRKFEGGNFELKLEMRERLEQLAKKHPFFHWHLEFPEVFAQNGGGGFDCVLGNPPWERIKLQEKEFFAQKDPEIATAPNAADRKKLIAQLPETNPGLWMDFLEAKRTSECESHFMRASDRYPLSAVGDINTYQIFAGLARDLVAKNGRAGIVIPSGIATDDSNKQFFADLTEKHAIVSLYDFENREGTFADVHRSYKFCLLTVGGTNAAPKRADFAFFLTNVGQMKEEDRHFSLSAEDIALLNPNTRTCPIFRCKRDAEITKAIYRRMPVLIGEDRNPWGITFLRMFDMANDSSLFRTQEQLEAEAWELKGNTYVRDEKRYLPLYEGKMICQFNHRAGSVTYYGRVVPGRHDVEPLSASQLGKSNILAIPRFWVQEEEVKNRVGNEIIYLIGFRDITNAESERTAIFSILPLVGVGHTMPLCFVPEEPKMILNFLSNVCSISYDFVARQKVGGTHLTFFILKQLPILPPVYFKRQLFGYIISDFIFPRALELTYTSWDLEPFARDCGYKGQPFRWDEERRFLIRCELDALYFHLYGIKRDDADHIMEAFPIVKRKDEQKYAEYRTKRVILECYDAMAEATKTGRPYKTILDPPPADPRVAHPPVESKG